MKKVLLPLQLFVTVVVAVVRSLRRTREAGSGDRSDGKLRGNADAKLFRFLLYPLEYLLYCEECQQIRCPRCVAEEVVNVYCPNCLFEVASSSLKTEGNR